MLELRTIDSENWKYLEYNYSVVKSAIPFVDIGSDHTKEQKITRSICEKIRENAVKVTFQPTNVLRYFISSVTRLRC